MYIRRSADTRRWSNTGLTLNQHWLNVLCLLSGRYRGSMIPLAVIILSTSFASYRIVSYRIVSYRIVSYRIVSYRIVSYRIVSYRIVSYRIVSYRIVSYRIVSYRIVSYRIVSYRIVSYRIVSYRIVSCCMNVSFRYTNGFHLSAIWKNTALVQWTRCEPLYEHFIHWTSIVYIFYVARKMNAVCIFSYRHARLDRGRT